MRYLQKEVQLNSGEALKVTLSGAANVLLMDWNSLNNYKNGRSFNYYGGYYTSSPVFIAPPYPGRWNVVVDLGGRGGSVHASYEIIRGTRK